MVVCPHCGKNVLDHMKACPFCKNTLTPSGYQGMTEEAIKRTRKKLNFIGIIVAVIALIWMLLNKK